MRPSPSSLRRLLRFALAALASALCASPATRGAVTGSAYTLLGENDLLMRLSLAGPASSLSLGLEATEDELGLGGCLSLGPAGEGGLELLAGPGSLSGTARLLVDPTSPTSLDAGNLVELDRSLESRSSVLGLGAGPLFAFAFGEGKGLGRMLQATALGLSYELSGPGGGVSALVAASFPPELADSSGWQPDPFALSALNARDPDRPCLNAALVARSSSDEGTSLAALVASYGSFSGPGLAFKLESQREAGPVRLSLAAGASGSSFRALAGTRQERLLDLRVEAAFELPRFSSLKAAMETQATSAGLFYPPRWGRSESLDFLLGLGQGEGNYLESAFEAELRPEGGGQGTLSLGLARKDETEESRSVARLGSALKWEAGFAGWSVSLDTELSGRNALPELELDLSLDFCDGGLPGSPVVARGRASADFPFGEGASLRLVAALPEKGRLLSIVGVVEEPEPLELSLRYRASLDSAMRRPRSRMAGSPKARSMVQRAAS